jgi:UDP-glucose 4-epimerase
MSRKKVLLIGAAGGLAKILIDLLLREENDFDILAVDNRNIHDKFNDPRIQYKRIRYTRSNFERVFRLDQFDYVIHLGRVSHVGNSKSLLAARLDQNLIGTKNIMDLSLKHKVQKIIVLSTHHVYGALADNPVFINEEAPLRASIKFPELRDVVEMDQICTNWMWKNKDEIETIILRPSNIIGPQIRNTISQYLTTPYAPMPIDFNPMFQFIHEFDMAHILCECLKHVKTGVYNVAHKETISLKRAKAIVESPITPIPSFVLEALTKVVSSTVWEFPSYLIEYLKYASIIDGSDLLEQLPEHPFRFSVEESLELLKIS